MLQHRTEAAFELSHNMRLYQYTETIVEKLVIYLRRMMDVEGVDRESIRIEAAKGDSKLRQVLQGKDLFRLMINMMDFSSHFMDSKIFMILWQKQYMQNVNGGVSYFG